MLEAFKPLDSKAWTSEITLGGLLAELATQPSKRLVFIYEGRETRPGYHVTEVKSGSFVGLDCGANPESWNELFIQLWDVEGGEGALTAGKFSAIIGKVGQHFALDDDAKLTFEVSDGVEPMRLFQAAAAASGAEEVRITLAPRAASCKPRDRWLAAERAAGASACCPGSKPAGKQACCG